MTVNLTATAGPTILTVTTGSACAWNVVSSAAFLTVTSGTGQTGTGTVAFTVAENTGAARAATLTIGGKVVSVNQAAAAGPPLVLVLPDPPNAVVGVLYNFNFGVATGGVEPIRYQLETAGGFPPLGLVLAPNGTLSGVPSIVGAANFSICAVDATGRSTCRSTTVTVFQADSGAFGNWGGTITLQAGCVTPLPFNYSWSGTIRRSNTGSIELVISIPLLSISNDVVPVTLTGNTISFSVDYGGFRFDYVGALSSDQQSVNGTFVGPDCNPTDLTQLQSGTWTGTHR